MKCLKCEKTIQPSDVTWKLEDEPCEECIIFILIHCSHCGIGMGIYVQQEQVKLPIPWESEES